jgi:hypothetical protein
MQIQSALTLDGIHSASTLAVELGSEFHCSHDSSVTVVRPVLGQTLGIKAEHHGVSDIGFPALSIRRLHLLPS